MTYEITAPYPHRDHLGEGPHWDAASGRLIWVDLHAGFIRSMDPDRGELESTEIGDPTNFAIPTAGGATVVGRYHTVEVVDGSGSTVVATVDPDEDDLRINDGKCDAAGRLVFGTMSMTRRIGFSSLYSLTPGGALSVLADGVSLSNGIGFDAAGERLYHVDSDAQAILVHDYDLDTGAATNRREFASIPKETGLPDGLAVDVDGGVWVALMWGGTLHRYAPDGSLTEVVETPLYCPTSVAFGGPDLRTLFVTSSSWLKDDPKENPELCGALLVLEPGVAGVPAHTFGA
jgi:sugar lactone lactonase YvrE